MTRKRKEIETDHVQPLDTAGSFHEIDPSGAFLFHLEEMLRKNTYKSESPLKISDDDDGPNPQ